MISRIHVHTFIVHRCVYMYMDILTNLCNMYRNADIHTTHHYKLCMAHRILLLFSRARWLEPPSPPNTTEKSRWPLVAPGTCASAGRRQTDRGASQHEGLPIRREGRPTRKSSRRNHHVKTVFAFMLRVGDPNFW